MTLKVLRKILSSKKPAKKAKAKAKARVLTAEGWKRRFSIKLQKGKKGSKK